MQRPELRRKMVHPTGLLSLCPPSPPPSLLSVSKTWQILTNSKLEQDCFLPSACSLSPWMFVALLHCWAWQRERRSRRTNWSSEGIFGTKFSKKSCNPVGQLSPLLCRIHPRGAFLWPSRTTDGPVAECHVVLEKAFKSLILIFWSSCTFYFIFLMLENFAIGLPLPN